MSYWKRHYVAIDTETTGLLPDGRMVEIAAVRCDSGGRVLGQFTAIVRPHGDPLWESRPGVTDAFAVNELDIETVSAGVSSWDPSLWVGLFSLLDWMGPLPIVVGHNVQFDKQILLNEHTLFRDNGPPWRRWVEWEWPGSMNHPLCTLGCDLLLRPGATGAHNLAATAERWGVVPNGGHRALADALTCAAIFAKQLPELSRRFGECKDPFNTVRLLVDGALDEHRRRRVRPAEETK